MDKINKKQQKKDKAEALKYRPISNFKELVETSCKMYSKNVVFYVKREKGKKSLKYRPITYKSFKSDLDGLGTKIIHMGLKGKTMAVVGENCYEWLLGYFAVTNSGGIIVPLDKELTKAEMLNQISMAECEGIFYTDTFTSYFEDADINVKINLSLEPDFQIFNYEAKHGRVEGELYISNLIENGKALLEAGDTAFLDYEVNSDVFSVLLFTSGTTETAKGVMLSQRNICTCATDGAKAVGLDQNAKTLSILPIHHTLESSVGILSPIYLGASVAFCEGLKHIAKNIAETKATTLIGVPLIFESIHKKIWKQVQKNGKEKSLRKAIAFNRNLKIINERFDLSRKLFKDIHEKFGGKLSMIVTGAAAIDPAVVQGFEDLGIKVIQGYGLTECAPLVTVTHFSADTYKKAGTIGTAAPSVSVKIVDQNEDGIGEIVAKGPNVMLGYYKDPERTAETIKDGWLYTGDFGYMDEDGFIFMAGRKKNIIVTKTGKNIYPEEVEFYLNQSKYICESLVHGEYSEKEEDTVVSATVLPDFETIYEEFGKNFSKSAVYDLIRSEIFKHNGNTAVYKKIRGFSIRNEEFIKTTTKKLKRVDENL